VMIITISAKPSLCIRSSKCCLNHHPSRSRILAIIARPTMVFQVNALMTSKSAAMMAIRYI
jgi:hypothetical protein